MAQNNLQVKTDLDELSSVLEWFSHLYHKQLSRSVLIQCQTILAEAFTNAVRHAHRDKHPDTPIEIAVHLHVDYLEIQIWDFGLEFDLEDRLGCAEKVDAEATGGRGIQLISRIADSFSYRRILNERNCLQMTKKLS